MRMQGELMTKNILRAGCGFLAILIFGGCTHQLHKTYRQIMQDAAMVNTSDGVTKEEAVLLAQNAVVKKALGSRLHSLKPYKIEKKVVWRRDNGDPVEFIVPPKNFAHELEETWRVLFKDRRGSFAGGFYPILPFYVDIDAKTGETLKWGLLREPTKPFN